MTTWACALYRSGTYWVEQGEGGKNTRPTKGEMRGWRVLEREREYGKWDYGQDVVMSEHFRLAMKPKEDRQPKFCSWKSAVCRLHHATIAVVIHASQTRELWDLEIEGELGFSCRS